MSGIFDPGDQAQGPSGRYSGAGPGGTGELHFASVADGAGGYGHDPTVADGPGGYGEAPVLGEGDQNSELTWEQRVLRLLSELRTVKGFKGLPPQLRDEVQELIDEAPDGAYL